MHKKVSLDPFWTRFRETRTFLKNNDKPLLIIVVESYTYTPENSHYFIGPFVKSDRTIKINETSRWTKRRC